LILKKNWLRLVILFLIFRKIRLREARLRNL